MANIPDILGIDESTVTSGGEGDLNAVLLEWANDLIKELTESLDKETSDGTSGALRQSILPVPSQGDVVEVGISMLDYYDFTNKGVRGIGGHEKGLKQVFGQYAFSSSMPDASEGSTLANWAQNKGLSPWLVSKSIFQRGIEGTQWYDKVFTQDKITDLIERVSKAAGKQLAVGIRKTLEKSK